MHICLLKLVRNLKSQNWKKYYIYSALLLNWRMNVLHKTISNRSQHLETVDESRRWGINTAYLFIRPRSKQ